MMERIMFSLRLLIRMVDLGNDKLLCTTFQRYGAPFVIAFWWNAVILYARCKNWVSFANHWKKEIHVEATIHQTFMIFQFAPFSMKCVLMSGMSQYDNSVQLLYSSWLHKILVLSKYEIRSLHDVAVMALKRLPVTSIVTVLYSCNISLGKILNNQPIGVVTRKIHQWLKFVIYTCELLAF